MICVLQFGGFYVPVKLFEALDKQIPMSPVTFSHFHFEIKVTYRLYF